MKCPVCNKTITEIKHWVHCPLADGETVCMNHCFRGCTYRQGDRCNYIGAKEKERLREEKEKFLAAVTTRNHLKKL